MNYEDEVIETARRGLAWSNVALTPEMEKLLRIVYNAGYKQAKIDATLLDRIRAGAEQQGD